MILFQRIKVVYDGFDTKFLYYFMNETFKEYIASKSVGATSTSIRKPMLENYITKRRVCQGLFQLLRLYRGYSYCAYEVYVRSLEILFEVIYYKRDKISFGRD